MLDASTQARLVHTVEEYRRESGAGVLAISHDQVLLDRWAGQTLGGRRSPPSRDWSAQGSSVTGRSLGNRFDTRVY